MLSTNLALVTGLPQYAPCIDILLAMATLRARNQMLPDIVNQIAQLYFRLVRPIAACADGYAVVAGRDKTTICTWYDAGLSLYQEQRRNFGRSATHPNNSPRDHDRIRPGLRFQETSVKARLVACGANFTIIAAGTCCYSRGSNHHGQLGLGDTIDREWFTSMGFWNAIAISCGTNHAFMIVSTAKTELVPLVMAAQQSPTGRGCADVSCDYAAHTLVNSSITLICSWGAGAQFQLGASGVVYRTTPVLVQIDDPCAVACGNAFTLILTHDGVYFCGLTASRVAVSLCKLTISEIGASKITAISACCNHYTLYVGDTAYPSDMDTTDVRHRNLGDRFAQVKFTTCTTRSVLSNCDLTNIRGHVLGLDCSGRIIVITTTRGLYMILSSRVTNTDDGIDPILLCEF